MNIISQLTVLSIICLILGLIFMTLEAFHPGFGAFGITGAILLILGVVLTAHSITQAFLMIMIILAILAVIFGLFLRLASKGKLNKSLVLNHSQNRETGYIGTEDLNYLLGKEGITTTVLRPSGTGDFAGVKLDVVSDSEFISPGTKVKIIKVEGRRIVVKAIK
ncbi:MAG: NfeD family protein [Bacillota bacterium]|nr:NfeD family protein [Bacillota bacterium]